MEVLDLEKYLIQGGNRLQGEVKVTGAKNSVLPILAATVISGGKSIISNIPKLQDVRVMAEILKVIGSKVDRDGDTMTIDTGPIDSIHLPEELVREMRSSIILMGALLTRFGEVNVSFPGGCEIGPRPIDLHLKSLRQMGAEIKEAHGFIYCKAKELIGADIQLDYPSVGATENIMLAAVRANGITVIRNAAREPEIMDLQDYLNKCGAKIKGAGTSIITIEGVQTLSGCNHKIIADRIVAGTLMAGAVMTKGKIILKDIVTEHLQSTIAKLRETGADVIVNGNSMMIIGPKKINSIEILQTLPFPGFPTDMQAQFMAMLSISDGTSIINETVFENRFKHAEELTRMGANIKTFGKVSVVKGVKKLTGARVYAKDLRGGAALVLAGLVAEGKTEVENIYHINRGYENLHETLRSLGAEISCI